MRNSKSTRKFFPKLANVIYIVRTKIEKIRVRERYSHYMIIIRYFSDTVVEVIFNAMKIFYKYIKSIRNKHNNLK